MNFVPERKTMAFALQPRTNYHVDHDRHVLWVLHRKNAGTSLREALGIKNMLQPDDVWAYRHYYVISVVRHPWERVTAGMYNPYTRKGTFAEQVQHEILRKPAPEYVDAHLWPQWVPLQGFEVDRLILFENLGEEWEDLRRQYDYPVLTHKNKGERHNWRDEDFDWNLLLPWYEKDFEFCDEWEKA